MTKKREKRPDPNKRLECLRDEVELMENIHDSVAQILALIKNIIFVKKADLKDLEKRACPKCGIIHSPYGTRRH